MALRQFRSDLLNCREKPFAATPANKSPHLFRFDSHARVTADDGLRIAGGAPETDDIVKARQRI